MTLLEKYRLQTLYQIRERAKTAAEESYVRAIQRLQAEERVLERLNHALQEMISMRKKRKENHDEKIQAGGETVDRIVIGASHLKSLEHKEVLLLQRVGQQKEVVEKQKKEVQMAKDRLSQATKEFKALDKHKIKWLTLQKKESEQREVEVADDIAQTLYLQKMFDEERF